MEQIGAALWAQRFILHAEISPILGQHSVFFLVIQDYRIIPGILRDQAPRRYGSIRYHGKSHLFCGKTPIR